MKTLPMRMKWKSSNQLFFAVKDERDSEKIMIFFKFRNYDDDGNVDVLDHDQHDDSYEMVAFEPFRMIFFIIIKDFEVNENIRR